MPLSQIIIIKNRLVCQMVTAEQLQSFSPLDTVDNSVLSKLAELGDIQKLSRGDCLFQHGSNDDSKVYLLYGELELTARDGKSQYLKPGEEHSRMPIASLIPRQYTVIAAQDSKIVRFDGQKFDQVLSGDHEEKAEEQNHDEPEMLEERGGIEGEVFTQIFIDISTEKFSLPNLPEVAMRAMNLLREDEVDANQLEAIIQGDPVIAARLLKVANSALYGGQAEIASVSQAIVRIGMDATAQMVTGFAMENLFVSDSAAIKQRMRNLWVHSVYVAGISTILARKTSMFDSGQAMLAGLMHDIGVVAVLNYIDKNNFDVSLEEIDNVIARLRAEIGSMILTKWNFSKVFIDVAEGAEDWHRDPQPEADLCDLILMAQMHSNIQNPITDEIPAMFELPAFKKLGLDEWSPETGLAMLNEAEQELNEIVQLFSA